MQWPIVVQGREVSKEQAQWLSRWVSEHQHWSRRKLAGELCAIWQWRDGRGRAKDLAARDFLLKMEKRGFVQLPALRKAYCKPRAPIALAQEPPPIEAISDAFSQIGPASLQVVHAGSQAYRRWAWYLSHHHYLGLRVVGQNIGYLVLDRTGREVAALLFGAPAWRCACRDAYLRERGFCPATDLARMANNTRFLIFPWVKVPHLASHVLGAASRRISRDWQQKYGQDLDWLETFVQRDRFTGACYRAANWIHVGATRCRGRQDRYYQAALTQKDVYLFALRP